MRPLLSRAVRGSVLLAAVLASGAAAQGEPGPPQAVLAHGYRFTYTEHGAGRSIILVHGGLSDLGFWNPLRAHLGDSLHSIAYSRRYHHPNPWRPDDPPYGAPGHANDLLAFIRALRLDRPILLGHDAGATVALLAALREPALVGGLILVEPPLDSLIAEPALRAASAAAERRIWEVTRASGDPEEAARTLLEARNGVGSWERIPAADREIIRQNAATVLLTRPDQPALSCNAFAGLASMPVLLVEGGRSTERFHAITQGLVSCLPSAALSVVPDAGHAAPWTHSEAVADILREFLRRLEP